MARSLGVVLAAAAAAVAAASAGPIRNTTSGAVQGMYEDNTESYLGIPFAAPPVGPLRWQPPAPPANWTGIRQATDFGSACWQDSAFTFGVNRSEDCLTLNVYVPKAPKSPGPMPVVVFWYGGSWEFGAASFPLYWATWDLEEYPEVVVVTSNYRLGPLGFLASHALQAASQDGSTGNSGIQDQRATLRWVRDNIGAFGGDPHSVTIQGESAGAGSVSNHIVMPRSAGLFHRGITESGPFAPWSAQTLDTSIVKYNKIAIGTGCFKPTGELGAREAAALAANPAVLACLRRQTPEALLGVGGLPKGLLRWSPVVDGVELTDTPANLAAAGKIANPVPVLGGTNKNEGTMFMPNDIPHDLNASGYEPAITHFLNGDAGKAAKLAALYPLSGCSSPWWCLATILGDGGMTCPTRATAKALTGKAQPYYQYFFTHELEVVKDFVPYKGVFHGSELVFVFDVGLALWEKAERALSRSFVQYWYNFIATGSPNAPGLPVWPLWNATNALNVLDTDTDGGTGIHGLTHLKQNVCDFWATSPINPGVVFGTPLAPLPSTSTDPQEAVPLVSGNPLATVDAIVEAAAEARAASA